MLNDHRTENWRKSSYSGGNNCIEVGRVGDGAAVRDTKSQAAGHLYAADRWRKSSRSSGGANNCVEVGRARSGAAVRDTKDRGAGYFTATPDQWTSFLQAIKSGRYDG